MTADHEPHVREHAVRISALEKRTDDHSERLRRGEDRDTDIRLDVASLRAELRNLAAAVTTLTEQMRGSTAFWRRIGEQALGTLLPLAICALIWALASTGRIPGVHADPQPQHQAPKP